MNDTIILSEIKAYLARLKTEVTISNSSNETDINIHAENLLRRILSVLFKCKILNSGKSIKKNNDSFDLFDENGRFAFQITSTNVNDKIINSLSSFVKYSWSEKYKELYIVLIGYDKKQYSTPTINKIKNVVNNKYEFDIKKNVIDLNDLYGLIVELNDTNDYLSIRDTLKVQFDEVTSKINHFNDVINFFEEYKNSINIKYKRINFFGLDVSSKPSEVDLESLFVPSHFKKHSKTLSQEVFVGFQDIVFDTKLHIDEQRIKFERSDSSEEITGIPGLEILQNEVSSSFETSILRNNLFHSFFDEEPYTIGRFFSFVDKTVILGKPGAGKSSLVKFITLQLLNKSSKIFDNESSLNHIPLRVQLYHYNQEKKKNSDNIYSYLFRYINGELAVSNISIDLIRYMLNNLSCVVFFDGLDEIFDVQDRISVRDDIEIFVKSHLKCKVVVTSRFESNTEVPFDSKLFSTYELNGFNDEQINLYIDKWYTVVEKEEVYKNEEIENFRVELNKIDKELIKNPLLLTLILVIYRNERELPTSKFDIYKGCTNTIVETRDKKEKRIDYKTAVLNKIGVFSSLAYWQFSQENEDKKQITNSDVINFLKAELQIDFADIDLAEAAAKEFIEFAKVRSIYFENAFTHKTFLEYFASHYIYTEYFLDSTDRKFLFELMTRHIGGASWSVIFELLFCEIDAQVRNSKIIDSYIDEITSDNNLKSINFFLQTIKYLKNISQTIIKDLLQKAFNIVFQNVNVETNPTECRICFESICLLRLNSRFSSAYEEAYSKAVDSNTIAEYNNNARAFLYEQYYFYIKAEHSLLNSIVLMDENSPYEYILCNYGRLADWDDFFIVLTRFLEKYGIKLLAKNYTPIYYANIFDEDISFNWINKALFSHSDIQILAKNYKRLRGLGVTKQYFLEAIKKCEVTSKVSHKDINSLSKHTKDEVLRKILKAYREKTYSKEDNVYYIGRGGRFTTR
ncbi:hypothetical protein GCM10027578_20160 [Spirosoma luteolum]